MMLHVSEYKAIEPDPEERQRIRDTVLLLRDRCGAETFSPSAVAQAVTGRRRYWRALMPAVREEAVHMARQGLVDLYRNGRPIKPSALRGVVQIGLPGGGSSRPELPELLAAVT